MPSFLGIGECMMELSPQQNDLYAKSYAGDVLNTLWYACLTLDPSWQVGFHSAFGTDPASQDMKRFIEAAGISCDPTPEIASRIPGLYMIHLDGAERSFSYWRDRSAARLLMRNPDLLWERVAQADMVYLSGITLAILSESDADLLIENLPKYVKKDALLAFDPNIRPRLWNTPDRMKKVITRMAAVSDIVLPSFDDERDCFGDSTPEATAARYAGLGVKHVVVKCGDAPTIVMQDAQMEQFPVPPISGVLDTTAAGDSFNGSYLSHFLMSRDVPQAVQAAQDCAAQVVCVKGALISIESWQEA